MFKNNDNVTNMLVKVFTSKATKLFKNKTKLEVLLGITKDTETSVYENELINLSNQRDIKLLKLVLTFLIGIKIDLLANEYKKVNTNSDKLPEVIIEGCSYLGRITCLFLCKPILLSITPRNRLSKFKVR